MRPRAASWPSYYGPRAAGMRGLGAGEWSRAYAFVLDGREVVIRFGDHVEDFCKDQVMAAHSRAALPIPAVIEIGAAGDGYFAVSERAPGELLDALDSDGIRAALPGLLAALDAMRAIDISGTEGYGLWAPDGTGPAASWAQALLAIEPGDGAGSRLAGRAGRLPGRHQALRPGLLPGCGSWPRACRSSATSSTATWSTTTCSSRVSRITAVIDWGNALYGDWLYDMAWLIFWWPWFPQWRDIDITAELERHWDQHGGPPPGLHHRLHACLVHIGLDAMAYNAYRSRWDDLARTASQVSQLI